MANHGRPRIRGWPPSLDFGCSTRKLTRYSEEGMEITTSSRIPFGQIVDLSASSKIVGGDRKFFNPRSFKVSLVIILMATLQSTRVFEMETRSI